MFAVAFFFAWLRVGTEFKFILFGLVIMPAIAVGFAMLVGLAPQGSTSLADQQPVDVRDVYASVPARVVRGTQLRNTRSVLGLIACAAAICGLGWMSARDPGSAVWYYAHAAAFGMAILVLIGFFLYREIQQQRLGGELAPLNSRLHQQQRRAQLGALGLVPAAIAQLVQFVQYQSTVSEIAMLSVFAMFLGSWFSTGRSGLFQAGILTRGVPLRWEQLRSHYWIPHSDFVVFTTVDETRGPHPIFCQVPDESRDAITQELASYLPVESPADAWSSSAAAHARQCKLDSNAKL